MNERDARFNAYLDAKRSFMRSLTRRQMRLLIALADAKSAAREAGLSDAKERLPRTDGLLTEGAHVQERPPGLETRIETETTDA